MKKILVIYLPIILITLLVSIPFIYPARLIALTLKPEWLVSEVDEKNRLTESPIRLTNIQGAFNQGSTNVMYQSIPLGLLEWDTDLTALLNGDLKMHLTLSSDTHKLDTVLVANTDSLLIENLHGYIRAASVNPFSSRYGLTVEGELKFSAISAQLQQNWLNKLSGGLSWNGGAIRYRTANAYANYSLTPLTGRLSLPENTATLLVNDSIGSAEVLSVILTSQGWATAIILRRFFDLAGKQWITTNSPDDIALQLEQKLW